MITKRKKKPLYISLKSVNNTAYDYLNSIIYSLGALAAEQYEGIQSGKPSERV